MTLDQRRLDPLEADGPLGRRVALDLLRMYESEPAAVERIVSYLERQETGGAAAWRALEGVVYRQWEVEPGDLGHDGEPVQ